MSSSSSSCLVVPTVGNISQDQAVVSPDPVQIFCFTAGYPRPTIMWFLNGQPVIANENATIDTIVSDNTTLGLVVVAGILRLNVTHPSDAGVYKCVSSNLLGNATNTTNLTVHCECVHVSMVTVTLSMSVVTWTLMKCGLRYVVMKYVKSLCEAPYKCTPLLQYVCSMLNYYLNQCLVCANCHLLSPYTLCSSALFPVRAEIDVSTFQELYVVNEGQNMTFSCSAFGVPAPSLSWRRDGVELSPSSDSRVVLLPEVTTQVDCMGPVYQTTRMLTYTNVMDSDTRNTPGDMYQCVAVNTVGGGNKTEEAEDVGNFSLFVRGKCLPSVSECMHCN